MSDLGPSALGRDSCIVSVGMLVVVASLLATSCQKISESSYTGVGVAVCSDGDLGVGLRLTHQIGVGTLWEDFYLPFVFSLDLAMLDDAKRGVGSVGVTITIPVADLARQKSDIELMFGGGAVLSPDASSGYWAAGLRLQREMRWLVFDTLEVGYLWKPVDLTVSGRRISDLGGVHVGLTGSW